MRSSGLKTAMRRLIMDVISPGTAIYVSTDGCGVMRFMSTRPGRLVAPALLRNVPGRRHDLPRPGPRWHGVRRGFVMRDLHHLAGNRWRRHVDRGIEARSMAIEEPDPVRWNRRPEVG